MAQIAMQACLYTRMPSHEAHLQRDNDTIADSSENDALLEFISEHTKWMPRVSMEAADVFSLDVAVQQTDFNDSLQLNRQLHTTLQRKQDEISALRERNSQLKELAKQAERLALLLDTISPSAGAAKQAGACSQSSYGLGRSPPELQSPGLDELQWQCTAVYNSQHAEEFSSALTQTHLTPHGFPSDSAQCPHPGPASPYAGVKRCLWPCQDDSGSVGAHNSITEDTVGYHGDAKRRKDDDDDELLQAQLQQYLEDIERDLQQPDADSVVSQEDPTKGLKSDTINVYGTFSGLQIVRTTPTTDSDPSGREVMCFKTSIREHCTIRTRVFPHGQSFTSPTPTGGYRFLWIPTEP